VEAVIVVIMSTVVKKKNPYLISTTKNIERLITVRLSILLLLPRQLFFLNYFFYAMVI